MAASPEWQHAYALTGSPAPRRNALSAADLAANPHLKAINDEAAQARRTCFPSVPAVARELQRFRDAGDEGRDADDLDAGSDRRACSRTCSGSWNASCR